MTDDGLRARIQRLEDRAEISDLITRYALILDDCQFEEVGTLFTEDAVFASPNSRTVGRTAIVENFRMKHSPYHATLHDPHSHTLVFGDDGEARGTVIGEAMLISYDTTVVTSIRYHDDYRKVDGRWLFASRLVLSVYGMTLDEYNAGGLNKEQRKRWPNRPVSDVELPDSQLLFPGYR